MPFRINQLLSYSAYDGHMISLYVAVISLYIGTVKNMVLDKV